MATALREGSVVAEWTAPDRLCGGGGAHGPAKMQGDSRVAVTRAVGRGSAQPVPASSFMISISPGDEDLNQEN